MLEYKRNHRYFTLSSLPLYIGIVFIALSIVSYFIRFYFFFIGIPLLFTGAIIVGIMLSLKSSLKSIEDQIVAVLGNVEDDTAEKLGLSRAQYERLSPVVMQYYDFLRENVLVHRDNDMTYRSSEYTKATMIYTDKGVRITSRSFSLINKRDEEKYYSFGFDEITKAEIEIKEIPNPTSKKHEKFKIFIFRLKNGDEEVFEMTIHSVVAIEKAVDEINSLIKAEKIGKTL